MSGGTGTIFLLFAPKRHQKITNLRMSTTVNLKFYRTVIQHLTVPRTTHSITETRVRAHILCSSSYSDMLYI